MPSCVYCTASSENIPLGMRSGCPLWYRFFTRFGQYLGILDAMNTPTMLLKLAAIKNVSILGKTFQVKLAVYDAQEMYEIFYGSTNTLDF
jgi:hypothetical protein